MRDIFVITSGKGGVGKTTFTSLLGKTLAKRKYRVLIIDADLGLKNVDLVLKISQKAKYDVSDVIKGRCTIQDALEYDNFEPLLHVLPLCLKSDVRNFPEIFLDQVIEELKSDYDYILIDSPAGIDDGFYIAKKNATQALVIVNDEECSLHDSKLVIKLLKAQGNLEITGVLNRTRLKRANLLRRIDEIKYRLGLEKVFSFEECDVDKLLFKGRRKDQEKLFNIIMNVIAV